MRFLPTLYDVGGNFPRICFLTKLLPCHEVMLFLVPAPVFCLFLLTSFSTPYLLGVGMEDSVICFPSSASTSFPSHLI